jgi:DNA (cytosine-5)-methyltransferase 1
MIMTSVHDFFSGCGGASRGFQSAGLNIQLGLDVGFDSAAAFQSNFPSARFIRDDIRDAKPSDVEAFISPGRKSLFCGRVPCRPFSPTNRLFPKNEKESVCWTSFAASSGALYQTISSLKMFPDYGTLTLRVVL